MNPISNELIMTTSQLNQIFSQGLIHVTYFKISCIKLVKDKPIGKDFVFSKADALIFIVIDFDKISNLTNIELYGEMENICPNYLEFITQFIQIIHDNIGSFEKLKILVLSR